MTAAPSGSPVIRVQVFARYAELLGADHIDLPAEGLVTVADVLSRIRTLPGGGAIGDSTLVAVNLKQASPGGRVAPGDEVAILPPLAGG
jgi:sulfur-carrier protein